MPYEVSYGLIAPSSSHTLVSIQFKSLQNQHDFACFLRELKENLLQAMDVNAFINDLYTVHALYTEPYIFHTKEKHAVSV